MSILNDVEIRKRCLVPTHKWTANSFNNSNLIPNTFLFSEMNGVFYNVNTGLPYTDKEMEIFDKNIQPFEGEFNRKRMITPFREKLRDEGVISYGLSSFGYDATCGSKFKIARDKLTLSHKSLIDPKDFNPHLFYEHEGDYCIIPPHGFVLTYTNEIFDIPEDIMSICMAKSTYARCFSGDTKIALTNGTSLSFEEIIPRYNNGERFWGYSLDSNGLIVIAEIKFPRKIGNEPLIEVVLDSGDTVKCTKDHKFLMRDGSYKEAQDLKEDDSLFPLYRSINRGYETVFQPEKWVTTNTYWLADAWNVKNKIYGDEPDTHRHHIDHNKLNNDPTNIIRMNGSEHITYHNHIRSLDPEFASKHSEALKQAYIQNSENEEWFAAFKKRCSDAAKSLWYNPENIEARNRVIAATTGRMRKPSARAIVSERSSRLWQDETYVNKTISSRKRFWREDNRADPFRQRLAERIRTVNLRTDISEKEVSDALRLEGTIRGAARFLNCDRSVFRRFPQLLEEHRGVKAANNHKVKEIREIPGTHDVYCLSVPEYGNFALESGVFVSNCGLVVGVTPLEPGWRGQVTIELSNTTDIPIKVYANEGICQFYFLQGSPSETPYNVRGGKYMDQVGIVLPRILQAKE